MTDWYKLNERGEPEKTDILSGVSSCMDDRRRYIKRSKLICKKTGLVGYLSTVFLCLNHNHWHPEKPVLWETMPFFTEGHSIDRYAYRATSRKQALRLHSRLLKALRNGHAARVFGVNAEIRIDDE